jgi:hypothetical protein
MFFAYWAMIHPSARMPIAATMIASGVAAPAPFPALLPPTTKYRRKIAPKTGPMKPTAWEMTSTNLSFVSPSFS